MRLRSAVFLLVACISTVALSLGCRAPAPPAQEEPAAQKPQIHGTLMQVMRPILFVNSNVIFTAQGDDPEKMKDDDFPATSPNPLTGLYGKWLAVENAGIALAEAANLLIIPGRMCSTNIPAPIDDPKWIKAVQGLRDAGMASYEAAKTKNQDKIVEVSETLANACLACHEIWRDVEPLANRCKADLQAPANP